MCFPRQKGFVHFTNGNEMFRQSQQGLTVSVEINTCLERAKIGISEFAEFYGLVLLPGTCMVHAVLLGHEERVSGKIFNPFSSLPGEQGAAFQCGSSLPVVPGTALCPSSAHHGTCQRYPWMNLCLPPSTGHLIAAGTQVCVGVTGGEVTHSIA